MANSITLASKYLDLLDKVYKAGAKSSILDVAPSQVKAGASAGTFLVRKLSLVGLGDYSSTAAIGAKYPAGDVTNAWESHTYDADRARAFSVDAVDDLEAMGVFRHVADTFIREHVTPEVDAYRFAALATGAGNSAYATLSTAAEMVAALNVGLNVLEDAEVPLERTALFLTPTLRRLVETAASTASTTDAFDVAKVVTVPSGRFYSECTTNAGATGSAGGFTNGGDALNFVLMDLGAAFTDAKHSGIKMWTPENNILGDDYLFQYRIYHDAFIYENKTDGIYVHSVTEIS